MNSFSGFRTRTACGECGSPLRQWPWPRRSPVAQHDSGGVLACRSEAQHRLGRSGLGIDQALSRDAAAAAARRTALLVELRLRLPEIARIVPDICRAVVSFAARLPRRKRTVVSADSALESGR
jgi:hypothetical protein